LERFVTQFVTQCGQESFILRLQYVCAASTVSSAPDDTTVPLAVPPDTISVAPLDTTPLVAVAPPPTSSDRTRLTL
jgi:hypothetical protein